MFNFFGRRNLASSLPIPTKCAACGESIVGRQLCENCTSYYDLGLERAYLEACPDERAHVHETAYNERMNAWAAAQRSAGTLPTPAQIVAAEQNAVMGVIRSGRRKPTKRMRKN